MPRKPKRETKAWVETNDPRPGGGTMRWEVDLADAKPLHFAAVRAAAHTTLGILFGRLEAPTATDDLAARARVEAGILRGIVGDSIVSRAQQGHVADLLELIAVRLKREEEDERRVDALDAAWHGWPEEAVAALGLDSSCASIRDAIDRMEPA